MQQFGELRLVRANVSMAERMLFRLMGVADPAHYLHHLYLRRTLDGMSDFQPRMILDAGCGPGDHTLYLARRYPDAEVLGVDIDAGRIRLCQQEAGVLKVPNLRFEVGDLTRLDPNALFDLIVSIDVLEHIPEQVRVLSSLHSLLSRTGRAFFHIPTVRGKPVPFSSRLDSFHEWAEGEHLADEHTAEEFVELLRAAGFRVESVNRTFGYWTGELATSLFCLPHAPGLRNKLAQGLLAPLCHALAGLDVIGFDHQRYAVGVLLAKGVTEDTRQVDGPG